MSNKKNKAAIIGSNGYVGRNMSFYLKNEGVEVFDFDIQSNSKFNWMNYSKLDILDPNSLEIIPKDVDCIYIFSGLTGTFEGFKRYKEFIEVNEIGLLNLLNYIVKYNITARVVFPSTRLIYQGRKDSLLSEEATKAPKSIYAINKLSCENILKVYSEFFGVKYNILRLCVLYGNLVGEDYSYGTIGFFVNQISMSNKINLFGNGEMRRTFTSIEDFCYVVNQVVKREQSLNQTYNMGGENFSLREVAERLINYFPNAKIDYVEWTKSNLLIESGDTIFDFGKLDNLVKNNYDGKYESWLDRNF